MKRMIGVSTKLEGLTRENFAAYRQNGIGAVEVSVSDTHYDVLDLKQVTKDLRAEELLPWSFHMRFWPFEVYNVALLNAAERNAAVEYQATWLCRAAAEGYRYAVIHPSGEPIADEDRAQTMRVAQDSLFRLAEVAQKEGIVVAVENLPRTCLAKNSEELLRLLSVHPHLRACFDTNHLLQEDPLAFIEALKDHIVTLHVSDYDFINERHWLPGDGLLDWKAVMKKLDEIGYNGVFMYETGKTKQKADGEERILTPADYRANADMLESLN